jgi:hypothetical protein
VSVLNLAIDEAMVLPSQIVLPKKKNVMLPVLVVLFLVSYGLLTMLVVEQGRTIQSQRNLIQLLFSDSTQLSALKMKEILKQRGIALPPLKNEGQAQRPSQGSAQQAMPQDDGKHNTGMRSQSHSQRPAMQKPPKPTADAADARRIPLTV